MGAEHFAKHRAKKSLGQNFLVEEDLTRQIVGCLALEAADTVVEIGPGHGALTHHLIKEAGQVIAVEFDRDLVPILRSRFANETNLQIVNEDALTMDFSSHLNDTQAALAKLVANLPYNISTPILQRLMEQRYLFSRLVLMFQKEVVERITAKPGSSQRGYLTVLVENAFKIEYLFDVPPEAFRPVPKVWSGVIRLTPKASDVEDDVAFRSLLSQAFGQKRKTLLNNLRSTVDNAATTLLDLDIDPTRRAETLTLAEWARLANAINKKTGRS
jgi:16S rRNA (adenine1518-N6/adenine1519-N6)-dimethyltransferase